MRRLTASACVTLLALVTSPTSASITFAPEFDGSYEGISLGRPDGLLGRAGGLTLQAGNPNMLLIGGNANMASGAIFSVPLIRDGSGHITDFAGSAEHFASAPLIDGGLSYGPGGVLFYTRFNTHQIGQIEPGSNTTDRVDAITGFGGGSPNNSVGSLTFVPYGFAGAGELKAVTFQQASFGTIPLSPDGSGTFVPGMGSLNATLESGSEGIAYVKGGNPGFAVDTLLVAEYTASKVGAYEIDANGNPIVGTRRDFITGLAGVEGAFVDPLTGDFLFSIHGSGEVFVVRGFAPPPQVPEATGFLIWLGLIAAATARGARRR